MSIAPLNVSAQTGLIPQTMLGYSDDGNSAIQILPTEITIGGTLMTNPIYVKISGTTGLTTSRPQGLNCNCDFDMNSNSITNVSSVTRFDGGDLYVQTQDGGNINLVNDGTGGSINLNSIDSVNLSGTIINSFSDFNMNAHSINGILSQKFNGGIDISDSATDAQISSNSSGQLSLGCSNNLIMNVNNNSIVQLTPASLNLTGTNGIIVDTPSMNFSNGIAINDTTNSIIGTTLTGFALNSNTSISLNAPNLNSFGDFNMNTNNITSLDNLIYTNGIYIQNGSNSARIESDEGGNLDLYVNTTATNGGLNIYNENGAYMTFYGNGIAINDATNSIVGTNPTGLTLTSNNSITLNAPTITIPNLVVPIPSDLTLHSTTYSSGINIQDNVYFNSITSSNGSMVINVGNGDGGTNLIIEANTTYFSAGAIFQNGINIRGSSTQYSATITGNENALQFNTQEIYLMATSSIYVNAPLRYNGTLSLKSNVSTGGIIELDTTGGTLSILASEVSMTGANASCSQVILTSQPSLPTGQAGAICYYGDSYYAYKNTTSTWVPFA
jgi:hypothetical protein